MKLLCFNTIFSVFLLVTSAWGQSLLKLQHTHLPQELSKSDLRHVSALSNTQHIDEVLDNILIPRVVGTQGHEKVFNYIKCELEALKWHVDVDEFNDDTPKFGTLKFKNIIATLNPNAERFLVLACHYDSKYFVENNFVGATDSAVPCAMMLNLAKVMDKELSSIKNKSELSLKLIFFDGEEAFVNWGPTDSIYGARHLAARYHENRQLSRSTGETVSDLQKIDILVLLDLIGHTDASFYSYFPNTQKWYIRLADTEDRLTDLGLLEKYPGQVYFKRRAYLGRIEDDHLPFLHRDVPILHLISSPFPREWHTPADNRNIIDLNATENINKILRVFVAEYLHLLVQH